MAVQATAASARKPMSSAKGKKREAKGLKAVEGLDPFAGLPTGEFAAPPAAGARADTPGYAALEAFENDQARLIAEAALRVGERGFPIFPCHGAGKEKLRKTPCFGDWQKPDGTASRDAQKIKNWWRSNYSGSAIGMPTGNLSGVFVIDIDVKKGAQGEATLAALEEEHGKLPDTFRVRTPSGGFHLFFKMPVGIDIKNSGPTKDARGNLRPGKLGPGIDVRGTGGYVLLAPSVISDENGERLGQYESVNRLPVVEAPGWLVELLADKTKPTKVYAKPEEHPGAAAWALKLLNDKCNDLASQADNRNMSCYSTAKEIGKTLVRGRLSRPAVEAALFEAMEDNGDAADDPRKARSTIRRGINDGLKEPLQQPPFPHKGKAGPVLDSYDNMVTALDWLGVALQWNEFARMVQISGLPGHAKLDDEAFSALWLAVRKQCSFPVRKDILRDYCKGMALENRCHPLCEYLDKRQAEWDGQARIGGEHNPSWLTTFLGTPDSPYTRAVGSLILIAAVRRARRPGTKFDQILILESAQGTGKSTAIEKLAAFREWFTDGVTMKMEAKELMEQTAGKWITEYAELRGNAKTDIDKWKATLSRPVDRARLPYDAFATEAPRQWVAFGTTNEKKYLRDVTGHRRSWGVGVGVVDTGAGRLLDGTFRVNLKALEQAVPQLWAEAAAREAKGESIELPSDLWEAAALEQEARMEDDPWIDIVAYELSGVEGVIVKAHTKNLITGHAHNWGNASATRLNQALEKAGWELGQVRLGRDRPRAWLKGSEPRCRVEIARDPDGAILLKCAIGGCASEACVNKVLRRREAEKKESKRQVEEQLLAQREGRKAQPATGKIIPLSKGKKQRKVVSIARREAGEEF